MAQQTDTLWRARLDGAEKYYREWSNKFRCDILEKYYEGFQWQKTLDEKDKPYTINKIYETIQIKLDAFIPNRPKFVVTARPSASDFNLELAAQAAQLKEDVLNSIIMDGREHFHNEIKQAYKDHFFRFGMIEVGYAADWVLNPNVPKPLLNKDMDPDATTPKKIGKPPEEIPQNERIYFKHIPAKRFRVGGIDHKYLDRCTWCGYWEYVDKDDLLAIPGLMNKDKIMQAEPSIQVVNTSDKDDKSINRGSTVKIWHLWHNKAKKRLIILDAPCVKLFERPLKWLNLIDYRPDMSVSSEGFYPIPPVFHWISPQDEINETREQLKKHRRRFIRKYQAVINTVDDEEIEKFETGDDGAIIKVKTANAITPIVDAPLGPQVEQAVVTSSDDLNQISGTSANARQVIDRTTATEANIINTKAAGRENAETERVSLWIGNIGRAALLLIRERFALGLWVKLTMDPGEQIFQAVQEQKEAYHWVTSEQLSIGGDFNVIVDVTSLSPQTQADELKKFLQFLSIITQFPQVAMSPVLIREVAYRCGYRNEKAIREMQQMALMHQLGVMNGVAAANGQGDQAAQKMNAAGTPNTVEQIRNQIAGQIGPSQLQ